MVLCYEEFPIFFRWFNNQTIIEIIVSFASQSRAFLYLNIYIIFTKIVINSAYSVPKGQHVLHARENIAVS